MLVMMGIPVLSLPGVTWGVARAAWLGIFTHNSVVFPSLKLIPAV